MSELTRLERQLDVIDDQKDRYEEALYRIRRWAHAYPVPNFPEPDLDKASELLKAGGMTLDAISASNMRHALEGVARIATEALGLSLPKDAE